MKTSILIVDDHPLYREALEFQANTLFPDDQVLTAGSAEEGLQLDLGHARLRMIMLDFRLRGLSGSASITAFRQRCPGVPIIVISASEDRHEATAALRAGAQAFVSKALRMPQMHAVLRRAGCGAIEEGEWHMPDASGCIPPAALPEMPERQREVLTLVCHGMTNKEIALRLSLAEVTVKMHLTHAFRVLGVVNRTQAIRAIHSLGLDLAAPAPA